MAAKKSKKVLKKHPMELPPEALLAIMALGILALPILFYVL